MTKSKERVFVLEREGSFRLSTREQPLWVAAGQVRKMGESGMKEGGLWGAVTFCSLSKCLTPQELRQTGFLSQTPRTVGTPVGCGTWTPSFPSVVPLR